MSGQVGTFRAALSWTEAALSVVVRRISARSSTERTVSVRVALAWHCVSQCTVQKALMLGRQPQQL